MMTRGLRSLSGLLVVALGVLASAGCGGKKEPSPLEQWQAQAGERPRGLVVLAGSDYTPAEPDWGIKLPPAPLLLAAVDSGWDRVVIGHDTAKSESFPLQDPKVLSSVSSARGIVLEGDYETAFDPLNATNTFNLSPFATRDGESTFFSLAVQSRHGIGIPIVGPGEALGEFSVVGASKFLDPNPGARVAPRAPGERPFWSRFQRGIGLVDDTVVVNDERAVEMLVHIADELCDKQVQWALGLQDKGAMVVDQTQRRITAQGGEASVLLDFGAAKASRKGVQVENVRVSLMWPGDAFDMGERRVRFAAGKSIHGSNATLPMERETDALAPGVVRRMMGRLADSAVGSTLAADLPGGRLLILTRDAETIAFRPLAEGEGNPGAKLEIKVGPDTPWTISRLRLDIMPPK